MIRFKKGRSGVTLLRFGVTVLLLSVLIYSVGIGELARTLLLVDPMLGFLAVLCLLFLFILGALNVWLLLKTLHPVAFHSFLAAYAYGWATSLIMPGQLGDASQTLFLKRMGIPFQCSTISYVLDKAITTGVLCWVAWYGARLFIPHLGGFWFITAPALGLLLGVLLLIVLRHLSDRVSEKLRNGLNGIWKELHAFRSKWYVLIINLILSIWKWLLLSLCYFVAFKAFGRYVHWPAIGVIPVLSTLVGYLPISLGGVGTVEFSAVYLFSREGIGQSTVLSVYLFLRLMQHLIAALMLALFWCRSKHS